MKKYMLIPFLLLVFFGCKTMSIDQDIQTKTTQNLQLGTIGELRDMGIIGYDYNHTALPAYQNPIKLKVTVVPFNNTKLKAYEKAQQIQQQSVVVVEEDSLRFPPSFLKIEIADRVAVLSSLNNDTNKDVFRFLKNTYNAHLIAAISVVFNPETANHLSTVQEVFMEQTGVKNYVLKTYENNVPQQTVYFNTGVVFGYQRAKACWKETPNHHVEIVDFVEGKNNCPGTSSRLATKRKKKINYHKL